MYDVQIPSDMELPWIAGRGYGPWGSFKSGWHHDVFKEMLYNVVEEQRPMTVRQVFYRAVVKNWVEKTEKGYGFVQRKLADMRRDGMLPYDWIVDESRRMRGSQGSGTPAIEGFIETELTLIPSRYSIDLLGDHDFSIQIWVEKEALLGVIEPVTRRWGVPLCPAKGYASLSFLYATAQDLEGAHRPAKIFYFGDYDPSGQDAIATVNRDLRELAPNTNIELYIVALRPEQITEMNLPTRPTKRTDTRSAGFGDESVELDAIEPNILRQMVEDTIADCFPADALEDKNRREEEAAQEIRRRLRQMLRR